MYALERRAHPRFVHELAATLRVEQHCLGPTQIHDFSVTGLGVQGDWWTQTHRPLVVALSLPRRKNRHYRALVVRCDPELAGVELLDTIRPFEIDEGDLVLTIDVDGHSAPAVRLLLGARARGVRAPGGHLYRPRFLAHT